MVERRNVFELIHLYYFFVKWFQGNETFFCVIGKYKIIIVGYEWKISVWLK